MADPIAALREGLRDRYEFERELGRGGMATVWLARDLRHDRPVALKVLHPELAATLGPDRFQREIKLTAKLQHPHILPVLDSGETAGQLWYTMPFVEGESLRHRLSREGQMPLHDAVRITCEVADALGYAHRQGVVHRDIKPDNILLSQGHPLVADFGVARAVQTAGEQPLTQTGMSVGTPAYMSPEQGMGDATLDGRSDLYSLGCVLYEMLTGEAPYVATSAQAIVAKRLVDPVPSARRLRETVPPAIDLALQRALAKAPADRFTTAEEFAQTLTASDSHPFAGGSAPVVRSSRAILLVAGAILVAAIAGSVLWAGGHSRRSTAAGTSGPIRLAVLPFENQGLPQDEYFADGMTDEVRGKLSGLPALKVIARSSSSEYKKTHKSPAEIGRELGVQYLLSATVRWEKGAGGDRVRVSPELIEVSDASTRWQQPFDAAMTDVFDVQAQIAGQVAEALKVALGAGDQAKLAEKPTTNLTAHDAFLRGEAISGGMSVFDAPTLRKATGYYEQAVASDSTYLLAWAHLSRSRSFIWANGGADPAEAEAARRAAQRASGLDSNNAETRIAQGNYASAVLHDYPRGLGEYAAGLRVAPNNPELLSFAAVNEAILGHWDSADVHLPRAQALDPRSATTALIRAHTLLAERRYEEAEEVSDRAIALAPNNIAAIAQGVVARVARGDLAGGQATIRAALTRMDQSALIIGLASTYNLAWVLPEAQQQVLIRLTPAQFDNDRASWALLLAQTYWRRGDRPKSQAYADSARMAGEHLVREQPENADGHAGLGLMLAYLGRKSEAIREGERAMSLIPVAKDALNGPYYVLGLAQIHVVVGQPEQALDLLESVLRMHCLISRVWLKLDPTFAPLRGNPRFERLVGTEGT